MRLRIIALGSVASLVAAGPANAAVFITSATIVAQTAMIGYQGPSHVLVSQSSDTQTAGLTGFGSTSATSEIFAGNKTINITSTLSAPTADAITFSWAGKGDITSTTHPTIPGDLIRQSAGTSASITFASTNGFGIKLGTQYGGIAEFCQNGACQSYTADQFGKYFTFSSSSPLTLNIYGDLKSCPTLSSCVANGDASIGRAAFSSFTTISVSSVPEPQAWAAMIAGMSLIGWRLRRRSEKSRPFAAA